MKKFNQLSRAEKEEIYEKGLMFVAGNKIYQIDYSYGVSDFILRLVMVEPFGNRYPSQGLMTPAQINVMLKRKVFIEG